MRDKRIKFVELAESRVNKALKQLELIGNLANKSNYVYNESDYKKIFRAIDDEVKSMKRKFIDADGNSRRKFKLKK
jgi:predicted transcriptional regulator